MTIVESGLLIVAAGAAARYAWQGVRQLFTYAKTKLTYCIQSANDNAIFYHIEEWIDQTEYIKTCKNISIRQYWERTISVLGYGLHTFKHNGVRFLVYKNKEESKDTYVVRENMTIIMFTRQITFLKSWLKEVEDAHKHIPYVNTKVFINKQGNDFSVEKPVSGRSPTLEADIYEKLVNDVQSFIGKEKEYVRRGIPYKRGYLLYGPPGNGKTTTILCIAQQLKKHIKTINLSEMTNSELIKTVATLDNNCILVLEDIDCVAASNTREEKPKKKKDESGTISDKVTLNVLLNCLDGLLTKHGQITFATTNYIEKLDPALIRAGRMDRKIEFGNASKSQALEYYNRFFDDGGGEAFAEQYAGQPMCELEQCILERLNNEASESW